MKNVVVVTELHERNQRMLTANSGNVYVVDKIVDNPFAQSAQNTCSPFGMAILKLNRPIIYGEKATAICLPPSKNDSARMLVHNKNLVFVGW